LEEGGKLMTKARFGMVGLGTMGRNFLLNVADSGFSTAGYDLDPEKRRLLLEEGKGLPVAAADSPEKLVESLESPRSIMLLVPAGPIVDSVIENLRPNLSAGDLLIDGGNSHYLDTERREKYLNDLGIGFIGVGVSGGEEGARHGPSIMPGGKREFYDQIEDILRAVSAKVGDEPCVAYMGKGSAGHFVKMVHNGIEYGLMQILAETYDFMLRVLKMDYSEMSATFAEWNNSDLNSFLVEITAEVLRKADAETGKPLVEVVLDKAAQKGTGKWTSQAAMDLGVPIPTIDSAVSMRQISSQKETRILIAHMMGSTAVDGHSHPVGGEPVSSEPEVTPKAEREAAAAETVASRHHTAAGMPNEAPTITDKKLSQTSEVREEFERDRRHSLESLKNTLVASFVVTYAQGLSLLQVASVEREYGLDLTEIAKIWRGGCIIRSALLDRMRDAFTKDPKLPNLILNEYFGKLLADYCGDWHTIVGEFSRSRVPSLCLSSGLSYFEAFRSERLPLNLTQAQRDFFGAHTYQRIDKEGVFHTPDWSS
jgi:6-phosphogluconate dehydrogenase